MIVMLLSIFFMIYMILKLAKTIISFINLIYFEIMNIFSQIKAII